jgi:CTP:molybdopterin cytidylyltransferase MocA
MLIPVDTFKRLTIKTNNLLKDKGLKGAILENGYDIVKVKASRGVLKDFDKAEDFN